MVIAYSRFTDNTDLWLLKFRRGLVWLQNAVSGLIYNLLCVNATVAPPTKSHWSKILLNLFWLGVVVWQ